jgi:hypothetical protein
MPAWFKGVSASQLRLSPEMIHNINFSYEYNRYIHKFGVVDLLGASVKNKTLIIPMEILLKTTKK